MTSNNGMTKLSKMLVLYRASEGIDQKDLSHIIGIDASTLCRVERGKSPNVENWLKIMKWMNS